jgi:2-(1,2-epoxy-1,2-dihydrophenyl)acetyl-CoA isomerase
MSLAAAADITVAARSARVVLAYTAIGLSPDGSGSWHLPRAVGLRRALDLALTNRPLTAEEAEAWGLVSRVVDDDHLEQEVEAVVALLASGSAPALAATKRLLRDALARDLEAQMAAETEAIVGTAAADGAEGIAAFLAKRSPRFR